MPNTTGPRSNGNPILRAFRGDTSAWGEEKDGEVTKAEYAAEWAQTITGEKSPSALWLVGAELVQTVFAARVLYRYAAVFGGAS